MENFKELKKKLIPILDSFIFSIQDKNSRKLSKFDFGRRMGMIEFYAYFLQMYNSTKLKTTKEYFKEDFEEDIIEINKFIFDYLNKKIEDDS